MAIDLGTGRTAVALSASIFLHTCAILDNGEAKCWGEYDRGRLGYGQSGQGDASTPPSASINFGTSRTAVAIVAGSEHTCALLNDGNLSCWGNDNKGQLGDGAACTTMDACFGGRQRHLGFQHRCPGDQQRHRCNLYGSPALPTGLNPTAARAISGTPTAHDKHVHNVTAVIGGATYHLSVWLSTSHGTDERRRCRFTVDVPMTNITFSTPVRGSAAFAYANNKISRI